MKNIGNFLKYYYSYNARSRRIGKLGIKKYCADNKYVSRSIYSHEDVNKIIYDLIISGKPFLVGRFGGNELSMLKTVEFDIKSKMDVCLEYLCNNAGFFPKEKFNAQKFRNEMLNFCRECDVLGVWFRPFEDYFIKKYMRRDLVCAHIHDIEPWKYESKPWSAALKGKKVLVIHPFEETIKAQYKRRKEIFPGTDILPDFELKTFKAIQTAAGEADSRFQTWFEALDYMFIEVMKIDFDIAIIGCGAYGAPLAAKIKNAGRQAIHLGGPTQILFGIKGDRWERSNQFSYVQRWFNDSWVRPNDEEKPKNSNNIENSCYW